MQKAKRDSIQDLIAALRSRTDEGCATGTKKAKSKVKKDSATPGSVLAYLTR